MYQENEGHLLYDVSYQLKKKTTKKNAVDMSELFLEKRLRKSAIYQYI